MKLSDRITLKPFPGTRLLRFRGDTETFILSLPKPQAGFAFLRTNIGHATIARNEIVNNALYDDPPLGRDWFDIPMTRIDDLSFRVTLPLCEAGHFEAKGYFVSDSDRETTWPKGPNIGINVEPADTCCANIIYNIFVRQFGPNKSGGFFEDLQPGWIDTLDKAGYTVIPPSGTFRGLIAELDFIVNELGCRILQLLPIHPTPTTYARMGRFGSPYAALTFTAVDPALAIFDSKSTPLEQFVELVDAVHSRNAKVIIDIAINHTGWAARLHETHPDWLVRDSTGQIEVPSAWGVRWEDLTKLDYSHKDLWQYMADVFLTWCRRGIDGFRCDAGYMIPVPAWQYIIASVREQFPNTIFFLEGLGGKVSVTRDLLNIANFNWTYSELFQNYDRSQVENYLPGAISISDSDGVMVHYAETHDNPRLASRSQVYARMRTALTALCSHQGAFGFANGVEWYATEKINVHESPSLNWGATVNQVSEICRLTTLLKNHPAFFDRTNLRLIPQEQGNCLALTRHHLPTDKKLMVLVNLDDQNPNTVSWNPIETGFNAPQYLDLLTGSEITVSPSMGQNILRLNPGQVYCLSAEQTDIEYIRKDTSKNISLPGRIIHQRRRAKVLDIFQFYNPNRDLEGFDPDRAARQFHNDPVAFCRNQNPNSSESRVITWNWPHDTRREVMVPPNHFLMVCADSAFRARIEKNKRALGFEESLPRKDGTFFALFAPLPPRRSHDACSLVLSVYSQDRSEHVSAPILFLSNAPDLHVKPSYSRQELLYEDLCLLETNEQGSALKCPLVWGRLNSRYDALLSANPHPDFPVNRWIMFTHCRIWVVYQDYSQEIGKDCIDGFTRDEHGHGIWQFRVPTGRGNHINITIRLELLQDLNAVRMIISRRVPQDQNGSLQSSRPVELILRPDIENRNFHETTKAYLGAENTWPNSVSIRKNGFAFKPDSDHNLDVQASSGVFVWEPEWRYMVHRPKEKVRGLDPDSDLFSPGYFSAPLEGNQTVSMTAIMRINGKKVDAVPEAADASVRSSFVESNLKPDQIKPLTQSLNQFLAGRNDYKTVIAGYPWFLDWGRDSLIFSRGLIAAGQTRTARDIIKLFGQYENNGTLPNMILGHNAENRDTSDAPLWLAVACSDLIRAEKNAAFLEESCGNRTVRQILLSIGQSMIKGTPNGIHMDPESGLIFSPSHFTWMDTNHPAGTPRQGFPIEIQGLWFAMLQFLSAIDSNLNWQHIADTVQVSIREFFYLSEAGYLSDCLHATAGKSARQAKPDDALRPNQLLSITLGAVSDHTVCRNVVTACEALLVPGAIRSLADRPVKMPLGIIHDGKALNDPYHPYQGQYLGDEDTRRKPAYHNGTAWTWMFPVFCEAWVKAFGKKSKDAALSWLSGATRLLDRGCVGHVPEILDGNYPHTQRGCDAQAWGISELVRVWFYLNSI